MKTHMIALIISKVANTTAIVDILQDEEEIECLASALNKGEKQPLNEIYNRRALISEEEDRQGDYVEEMLCKPFVKPSLQKQGVLWLKSKIKLERHRKAETDAVKVIANYAYQIFQADPSQTDFTIAGPRAQVRVRIFPIPALAS